MTPEIPAQQSAAQSHGGREPIQPIVLLLFGGIVFFVIILVVISKWSPSDGQTFQVIGGLVTGFAGAFLAYANPPGRRDSTPRNGESGEK